MIYHGNCRLGDLFDSRREKGRGDLPTLSVTLNDGLVDRQDLDRKMETNLSDEEHLLVRKGDIAYNMMRMWQGASGLATKDGLVSPAYVVLKPKQTIDSRFATYLLKTKRLTYLLWAYSHGLTDDRLRLYFDDFSRIPVNVPNVEEQRKIAEVLSIWDRAIEAVEKLIKNSKAQKKALMQKLLIGRQSHSKSSQQDWPIITLGKVADFAAGATPSTKKPEFWGGDIPWMSSGEINQRQIHDVEGRITDLGLKSSSTKLIPKNNVLIALAGQGSTRGKVGINRIDLSTNQSIAAIIPDQSRLDFEFLFYYLDYRYQELRALSSGDGGRGGLSLRILRQIKVFLPPMEEQKAIAVLLNCADKQIDTQMRAAERLAVEKSCLMQQLMAGKRRVKLDAPSVSSAAA